MGTINQVKQLAATDTPLLFFQCVLPSLDAQHPGDAQYWCSHSIIFNSQQYAARVLKHNLFDLQLSADDAMDGISQLSLTLANADSSLSELNRRIGFKGAQLTVYFAFADLPSGTITTESTVLFRGIAGDPDEITEDTLRLTFSNRLSLQRVAIPDVRVQRTCPWTFPSTSAQRIEAKDGGANGRYSRFYRCGYSADVPGGAGNLMSNGQAFTTCDGSRGQCTERGMFGSDISKNVTQRFGGFEFVPSAITVRTSGSKTSHLSPLLDNTALYNDPVPLVYGTGWLKAPVIFSRNDGDLTHMEVLLGLGALSVLKTVVNDIEIPLKVSGQDMTTSGWYSVVTSGQRQGSFNTDFVDGDRKPLGDPYGSIAVLSVVVPNRISTGNSLPTVEVLLQGIGLDTYDAAGNLATSTPVYSNSPAWIVLDILRRCGWATADLNLPSFAAAAAYCGELITTTDLNNNTSTVPRSPCNLILTTRQSAAAVIRGIRVSAGLMLRYGATGLLELVPETTLKRQQGLLLPDGSNSTAMLNEGWPAYEFSDGTGAFSGIIRIADGSSSVRLSSRGIAETSNRLSVEFQDETNEYQQDSLSIADSNDSALIGYEISSSSTALGIANFNQATRVLLRQLDKSTKGNQFIQFQTSFRALKVRPGDIITVTYAKEFLDRMPFRVVKLSPSMNYQTVTILAQIHNDDWYSDNPAVLAGAGRQPGSNSQMPRPLLGTIVNATGSTDLGVTGTNQTLGDGTALQTLTVSFAQPTKSSVSAPQAPLVSLSSSSMWETNGTLVGGTSYYYAVSAIDVFGNEGPLSFTIPVSVPDTNNEAKISGLSFSATTTRFNVYRGATPQLLYKIKNVPLSEATADSNGYFFKDTGFPIQPIGPPDPNFDHANFYYRPQYAGPFLVAISTSDGNSSTIGNEAMGNVPSIYANAARMVRIVGGTGTGQERRIIANDATTLTVSPAWSIKPDASSSFVVVDSSWKFAAVSMTSPAQFQVPYQAGAVMQISGRGANVQNQEGSPDLCPMTLWSLSGGPQDSDTPSAPKFTASAPGAGNLVVSEVGFSTSERNVAGVTSGTLSVFTWDEIKRPTTSLAISIGIGDQQISTAGGAPLYTGQVVQVGTELMVITEPAGAANSYFVDRTTLTTLQTTHNAGEALLLLDQTSLVLPFQPGFFQNKASINYLHTVSMPDCRVLAAQMFMTNAFGDGQTTTNSYVAAPLRTLSGGQFSLQLTGYLTTQTNAAPALIVQKTHAIRDVWASMGQETQGYAIAVDILQNGAEYCSFVIPAPAAENGTAGTDGPAGKTNAVSYVDGSSLPPLQEGATLTMNVTLQTSGTPASLNPGKDLTVTVRF